MPQICTCTPAQTDYYCPVHGGDRVGQPPQQRRTGTVKWFSRLKGYGFILPDDGGPEAFVHYSAINSEANYRNLYEGDRVSYDLVDKGKGPQAQNVTVQRGIFNP